MTIEMNVDYLLKNKITANQYLILRMLLENQLERLTAYKKVVGEIEYLESEKSLIEMGFLGRGEGGLYITEKCLKTFKGKGYFEEFYAAFPVSVIRPDGTRESLRTAKKLCEKRYRNIAKRKDVHEHIMKCLGVEIKDRTARDSLKFMKKMPNWLNSEAWIEYEDKAQAESIIGKIEEDSYGTEVI